MVVSSVGLVVSYLCGGALRCAVVEDSPVGWCGGRAGSAAVIAAIDRQHGAGHEACGIRGQKQRRTHQILGRALSTFGRRAVGDSPPPPGRTRHSGLVMSVLRDSRARWRSRECRARLFTDGQGRGSGRQCRFSTPYRRHRRIGEIAQHRGDVQMPPPLAFSSGCAARDRRMALFRLMSMTARKVSSFHSSPDGQPRQFTRTSSEVSSPKRA